MHLTSANHITPRLNERSHLVQISGAITVVHFSTLSIGHPAVVIASTAGRSVIERTLNFMKGNFHCYIHSLLPEMSSVTPYHFTKERLPCPDYSPRRKMVLERRL